MRTVLPCITLTFVALGACTAPELEPRLELGTDGSSYVLGAWGILTLTNLGARPVGPGGALWCWLEIEQNVGDEWRLLGKYSEVCGMGTAPGLAPGASEELPFQIRAGLFEAGGVYRFRVSLSEEITHKSVQGVSDSFTVEG